MKVTYLEKGVESDFRRIGDHVVTFNAVSYFKPEGTSVVYFKLDQFNYKTIADEDILSIDDLQKGV